MPSSDVFAAVDLGSNSFHLIVCRNVAGRIEVLHKEKIKVMLAHGLDVNHELDTDSQKRAIAALTEFSKTLTGFCPSTVKVVGTYTLRVAKNRHALLSKVKTLFPFEIEVVSGQEEARLIYQGVATNRTDLGNRFVMDIGGGSTEFIIGNGTQTHLLSSRNIGCVTLTNSEFKQGALTQKVFDNAIIQAEQAIEPIYTELVKHQWQVSIGTSGTIKTISALIQHYFDDEIITRSYLHLLMKKFISFGHISAIEHPLLTEERKKVICAGLATLIAAFELFSIDSMEYCDYALREGVINQIIDAQNQTDIRERSVINFAQRFAIDQQHTKRVQAMLTYFLTSNGTKSIIEKGQIKSLFWAANLFEIGLSINSSSLQKHSAYIVENSQLPGFNQNEQTLLTLLIRNHRKKIKDENLFEVGDYSLGSLLLCVVLFRLAILLTKKRQDNYIKLVAVSFNMNQMTITFNQEWIGQQSLLLADLEKEIDTLAKHNFILEIQEVN